MPPPAKRLPIAVKKPSPVRKKSELEKIFDDERYASVCSATVGEIWCADFNMPQIYAAEVICEKASYAEEKLDCQEYFNSTDMPAQSQIK